ncbi:outer membrane beta-barrel protein [Constantimarinum furrinae]|uniref:Outer membrane protein beta-barrel domain-containing protein n=1 Tax=Constantimarinum furrinae TaxID=2562285 RepID=A0A7G8PSX3_9FLAO|nr:outer membrane beta-barrel protein [Constantimarinum furrinae]QNJ97439.1 hypothetical protein ALE3EI_0864 [Constantimarinum furrinae]
MKEKKHIDELFKERFQNFEASPSPEVWTSIQAKLNKEKKERKVIPLWWKVGGVAALLALLLTIGNSVFDSSEKTNTLTNEQTNKSVEDGTLKESTFNEDEINDTDYAVDTETIEDSKVDVPETKDTKKVSNKTPGDAIYKKANSVKTAVASEEIKTKKQSSANNKDHFKNDAVLNTGVDSETLNKKANAIASEKNKKAEKGLPTDKTETLINTDKTIAETIESKVAGNKTAEEKTAAEEKTEEKNKTTNQKSIFDAIEESKKTEEAVAKKSKPDNRWDVSPNVGPVYYNTLSNGSSLDPSFADNNKSGDVNFSYGVNVAYNISEKFSVRTGINNVDLSYSTSGIELGTGPVSSALKSIDYGGKSVVLTAVDKGGFDTNIPENPLDNITPKSTSGEAMIHQNITYYEVPLELKYALLNKRFGINMIGGFSTLFLGNNDVSVSAGDFSSTLGEANNLNSVSFTTNFGLGFDYRISRMFKFNIEPMFKYQLNPYTDSSVGFKPYYFGIYSGLSFRF